MSLFVRHPADTPQRCSQQSFLGWSDVTSGCLCNDIAPPNSQQSFLGWSDVTAEPATSHASFELAAEFSGVERCHNSLAKGSPLASSLAAEFSGAERCHSSTRRPTARPTGSQQSFLGWSDVTLTSKDQPAHEPSSRSRVFRGGAMPQKGRQEDSISLVGFSRQSFPGKSDATEHAAGISWVKRCHVVQAKFPLHSQNTRSRTFRGGAMSRRTSALGISQTRLAAEFSGAERCHVGLSPALASQQSFQGAERCHRGS